MVELLIANKTVGLSTLTLRLLLDASWNKSTLVIQLVLNQPWLGCLWRGIANERVMDLHKPGAVFMHTWGLVTGKQCVLSQ